MTKHSLTRQSKPAYIRFSVAEQDALIDHLVDFLDDCDYWDAYSGNWQLLDVLKRLGYNTKDLVKMAREYNPEVTW